MNLIEERASTPSVYSQLVSVARVAPQFANRLCARLETAESMPSGVSGLLFGAQFGDVVTVQAFRSLLETDIAAICAGELNWDEVVRELAKSAETDPALAPLDVIGWYSFRDYGGLNQDDIGFHERLFAAGSNVALLVRRVDSGFLLFELYARPADGLITERNHRSGATRFSPAEAITGTTDIPLRGRLEQTALATVDPREIQYGGSQPGQRDRDASALERRRTIIPAELPLVEPPPPASANSRKLAWILSGGLFAAAAAGTFAVLVLNGIPSSASNSILHGVRPDSGLNLRVEAQGDRVLLSWSRTNPAVRSATSALLRIDDGGQHRDVHLEPAQVANGAVLYRPHSDDVNFRLEIQASNGSTEAESLRVLDSGTAAGQLPLDISASSSPEPLQPAARAVTNPLGNSPAPAHVWRAAPESRQPDPVKSEPVDLESRPPLQVAASTAPNKFDVSRLGVPVTPPAPQPATEVAAAATPKPSVEKPVEKPVEVPVQQARAPEPKPIPAVQQTPEVKQQSSAPAQNVTPAPAAAPAPTVAQRFTAPRAIRRVPPDISKLPRSLAASTGEIEVLVSVDENGHVTAARAMPVGRIQPQKMMILAENTAKQWLFEPARRDGRPVPGEHYIMFQFGGR